MQEVFSAPYPHLQLYQIRTVRSQNPQLYVRHDSLQLERSQLTPEDLDEVTEDSAGMEAAQEEGVQAREVLGGDGPMEIERKI